MHMQVTGSWLMVNMEHFGSGDIVLQECPVCSFERSVVNFWCIFKLFLFCFNKSFECRGPWAGALDY